MTDDTTNTVPTDCGGCSLHDALVTPAAMQRREFFRAAGLAMASLGLLGVGARDAGAMSPMIGEVTGRDGATAEQKQYAVPTADGVAIDRDNSVIIARAAGKVYAFALACPHRNTALKWNEREHEFQCPKHHSRYGTDGTFIDGRATRNMDRLDIRRAGAVLIVDIDKLYQADENPKEWAAAFAPA
jgi:nitrite reductase/ring-hydroxylating ferredoxin subunit